VDSSTHISVPEVSESDLAFDRILASELRGALFDLTLVVIYNFFIRRPGPQDLFRCGSELDRFRFAPELDVSAFFKEAAPELRTRIGFGGISVSGGAVVAISMPPTLFSARSVFYFPDDGGAVGASLGLSGALTPQDDGYIMAKDKRSCHMLLLSESIPKEYRRAFELLVEKHRESTAAVLHKPTRSGLREINFSTPPYQQLAGPLESPSEF
jgi:hypothetical protein